jgi:hypothetical protein
MRIGVKPNTITAIPSSSNMSCIVTEMSVSIMRRRRRRSDRCGFSATTPPLSRKNITESGSINIKQVAAYPFRTPQTCFETLP